jgi:ketosteroid isomerase-like protein
MKKSIMLFLFIAATFVAVSQTKEEKKVEAAVAYLISALESGDKTALENITMEKLSYGHSGGGIETREQFIENLVSGKSDFVTIKTSNQTISISGNTSIVRLRLDAKTMDKGKEAEVHLHVMLVFQKEKGDWKMLARQAVKLVS